MTVHWGNPEHTLKIQESGFLSKLSYLIAARPEESHFFLNFSFILCKTGIDSTISKIPSSSEFYSKLSQYDIVQKSPI